MSYSDKIDGKTYKSVPLDLVWRHVFFVIELPNFFKTIRPLIAPFMPYIIKRNTK